MASISSEMVPQSKCTKIDAPVASRRYQFCRLTDYCPEVELGPNKASCAAIQTEICSSRIRKEGSHVRTQSRGNIANSRYGYAGNVVLAANCNLYALCHHYRLLPRGLLRHYFS
jgi:hypothetical protein